MIIVTNAGVRLDTTLITNWREGATVYEIDGIGAVALHMTTDPARIDVQFGIDADGNDSPVIIRGTRLSTHIQTVIAGSAHPKSVHWIDVRTCGPKGRYTDVDRDVHTATADIVYALIRHWQAQTWHERLRVAFTATKAGHAKGTLRLDLRDLDARIAELTAERAVVAARIALADIHATRETSGPPVPVSGSLYLAEPVTTAREIAAAPATT